MLIFLFNLIFDYNINAGKLQSIIIGFLRQKFLLYFLYAKSMVDLQSYELLFFFSYQHYSIKPFKRSSPNLASNIDRI